MNKASALLLIGLSLVACTPATQRKTAVTPAAPAPSYKTMSPLSAAPLRNFNRAQQIINPTKTYRAVLNTSKGFITLELNAKAAPIAVNNFVFLALNHYYDGTRFHRVIEGFMAQGGDPLSADLTRRNLWGTGGPGYQFAAEVSNGLKFDRVGVLGMARSASLSSQGSQFFITLAPADFLSGNYTVFGRVVSGQDVLNRLTRTAQTTGFGERPIAGAEPDTLNSVTIQVLE